MNQVQAFAEKVVAKLQSNHPSDKEFAFDPSIIILIAEALVPLIQALQKCKADSATVAADAANPTLIQRIGVRLNLRRSLVDNGDMSPRAFAKNASGLVNAVLSVAANSTPEEIQSLLDDAG
jgi:hypothetical protein